MTEIQEPGGALQLAESDLVRYRAPEDVTEGRMVFEVVEVRGPRVLIRLIGAHAPTTEALYARDLEKVERRLLPVNRLIPGDVLAATRRRVRTTCPGGLKYPGKYLVWLEGEDYTRVWGARTTVTVERRVL